MDPHASSIKSQYKCNTDAIHYTWYNSTGWIPILHKLNLNTNAAQLMLLILNITAPADQSFFGAQIIKFNLNTAQLLFLILYITVPDWSSHGAPIKSQCKCSTVAIAYPRYNGTRLILMMHQSNLNLNLNLNSAQLQFWHWNNISCIKLHLFNKF